ncbi:hypothetical protein KO491_09205, partial [Roseovarius nubinhibens]|uniref:hypothetical protein n=1 Tax=Roseovarius nubinhibens TaxID=314263 RepID=UPI001C08B791
MTTENTDAVGDADRELRRGERPFDPWRSPITPSAQDFVDEVAAFLEAHEEVAGLRERKRRPNDQRTFERMVTALASDLAINALCDEATGLHLSRSNRHLGRVSRYGNAATSKTLRQLLDLMAAPGVALIEQELGFRAKSGQSKRTVVFPSVRLQQLVQQHELTPADFGERPCPEPIELKSYPVSRKKRGQLIDYPETALTMVLRSQVREINAFLSMAKLDFTGPAAVDVNKRQLRRVFTRESFESGGRLFGGCWQPMSKRDRLSHLKINGEDVVELDYGQVMPRLVYALAGRIPGMYDLYAIPGFEQHRPGIKKVASAMLFVEAPISRFPVDTRHLFPESVKIGDVTDAIMAAHPEIADFFFTGIGHRCQFLESQILVEVLLA